MSWSSSSKLMGLPARPAICSSTRRERFSFTPSTATNVGTGLVRRRDCAIGQVLLPGGVIHREGQKHLGLGGGRVVSGLDDRVSVVET